MKSSSSATSAGQSHATVDQALAGAKTAAIRKLSQFWREHRRLDGKNDGHDTGRGQLGRSKIDLRDLSERRNDARYPADGQPRDRGAALALAARRSAAADRTELSTDGSPGGDHQFALSERGSRHPP